MSHLRLTQAHRLFSREADRAARCAGLVKVIREHIIENLDDLPTGKPENRDRYSGHTIRALPDLDKITDPEALEVFLSHLQSLGRPVTLFDFVDFIKSMEEPGGPLIYRALREIDGFIASYDAVEACTGIQKYRHLDELLFGPEAETVCLALMRAALRLGEKLPGSMIASDTFHEGSSPKHCFGYFLRDDELATMVASNPEQVDSIVDAVLSRGFFPGTEVTWEIINSDSKALSEGML